ncbi:hypothetical protein [Cutibacterium modestum]|uniref:hypothetical protein n=1 Tax=Cutibacterium modestum TaxID=2559073 RepID=UPI0020A43159|nr:hypothetical protein [Cutibacterium modestum]
MQKEIGYFQRALPWLAATNPVSASEPKDVKGSPVHAYQRTIGKTGPRFIGFRLSDSNATTDTTFTTPLDLDSSSSTNRQHVVDDRDPAISYQGPWVQRSDPGASGRTVTVSSRKGDTAIFTFSGTGISVVSGTGTDHGMVSLRVDDAAPVEATGHVNSDQNRPTQKVLHEFTGLSSGTTPSRSPISARQHKAARAPSSASTPCASSTTQRRTPTMRSPRTRPGNGPVFRRTRPRPFTCTAVTLS